MRKDPINFRERFNRWKQGEQVYENGRPIPQYQYGKDEKAIKAGANIGRAIVEPVNDRARAMYNAIDPRDAYPETYLEAAIKENYIRKKMHKGNTDQMEYEVGDDLPDRVSDAAWRKRLGYMYDTKLLPRYNGDTVRLPKQIELEIPTDTNKLKERIALNEDIMRSNGYYGRNPYLREAVSYDKEALESLRKTYKTGKKVKINEQAYNSRQWVKDGHVNPEMSPLNALQNYTVWYDKNTNRLYYHDTYDFNEFDWAIPGNPYQIKGYIDLNQKR